MQHVLTSISFVASAWCAGFVAALAAMPAYAQRGPDGVRVVVDPLAAVSAPSAQAASTRSLATSGPLPTIVLTGYWPPSNEAVRRFSTNPAQNPQGWIGQNWEGRGYDVHSFFPEFNPPNCDSCGQGTGDLEVDYQDTTADFWALVPPLKPIAVLTLSRGFPNTSWELEMNQFNRNAWAGDFTAPFQPTPNPPDTSYPVNGLRPSTLPVLSMIQAVNAAGIGAQSYLCYSGNGGGYLSEFIAYLGVWYQSQHADPLDPALCLAAGHVHVGGNLQWDVAEAAAKTTLRELIDYLDTVRFAPCLEPQNYCTAKLTSGGCLPSLAAVGYPSLADGSFQVRLRELESNAQGFLLWSMSQAALPFQGGTLCLGAPIQRAKAQAGGFLFTPPPCEAEMSFLFRPAYTSAFAMNAGQTFFGQGWSRDVGDPVFQSSLTDGLSWTWCP